MTMDIGMFINVAGWAACLVLASAIGGDFVKTEKRDRQVRKARLAK
jgi:hypothetical protein